MLKRAIIKLSTNCSLRKRDGKSDGKYNEKRSFCRKVALLLSASVLKYYIHKSAFYEDRALTFMNGYSYFSYDTFFFTIMLKLIRTSQRNAVMSEKKNFLFLLSSLKVIQIQERNVKMLVLIFSFSIFHTKNRF